MDVGGVARNRMQGAALARRDPRDRRDLARLVRRLADEAMAWTKG